LANLTAEFVMLGAIDEDMAQEWCHVLLETSDELLTAFEEMKQAGTLPKPIPNTDGTLNLKGVLPTIRVFLSSPGGDTSAALTIYNVIKHISRKGIVVEVIVTDSCYSAAMILLQAANIRLASPQASFFTHSLSYTTNESFSPDTYAWPYKHSTQKICEIMASRNTKGNTNPEVWKPFFATKAEHFMDVDEALASGVVDGVYPPL
jgi:ATP-dependent protease ClpP protease subunit